MYTIRRAAEEIGIPVATLRAWERRYGIVSPRRSAGGYRLYDDAAISVLRRMHALVDDGWAPAQAAEEVRRHGSPAVEPASAVDVVRPATGSLLPAARALDTDELAQVLDRQFSAGGFESVVDGWLMPALHEVGDAWATGELSVAGEHLVANAVMRRLATAYEAAGVAYGAPRVLLALPPGCHHQIGLLAFATAARRRGLHTHYLGADLPVESWRQAIRSLHPVHVVTTVTQHEDVPQLVELTDGLADMVGAGDLRPWVGGLQQDHAPDLYRRLGHNIGDGARTLADAARSPRP